MRGHTIGGPETSCDREFHLLLRRIYWRRMGHRLWDALPFLIVGALGLGWTIVRVLR